MSNPHPIGRPRIDSTASGRSPAVQARLGNAASRDFQKLREATGLAQSTLVREAIELLLTEYGSITGRKRKLRYADFRPVLLPDSLDELTGPTSGLVTLPVWIDWTLRKTYNLDDKFDRADFYRVVISEAQPSEMAGYLEGATLVNIWPSLGLPKNVRPAWEKKFPELISTLPLPAEASALTPPGRRRRSGGGRR